MKLFISVAEEQKGLGELFANSLHNSFKGKVAYFLSSEKIIGGENWKQKLRAEISNSDAIIIILTPLYIKSPWFYIEWSAFWLRTDVIKSKIFIFQLDEVIEVPEIVRDSQIIDQNDIRKYEEFYNELVIEYNQQNPHDLILKVPYEEARHLFHDLKVKYDSILKMQNEAKYSIYRLKENGILPIPELEEVDYCIFFYESEVPEDKNIFRKRYHVISEKNKVKILHELFARNDFKETETLIPAILDAETDDLINFFRMIVLNGSRFINNMDYISLLNSLIEVVKVNKNYKKIVENLKNTGFMIEHIEGLILTS